MSYRIPPSMDDADGFLPLEVSRWFAVRSNGGGEQAAFDGLTERKFTVFLPKSTHWRRSRRSGDQRVERPLFPGYLFVLCTSNDFAEVRGIEAVSQFVRYVKDGEMTPMPFPLSAIIELQADECRGLFDYTRAIKPQYKPKKGDKVMVTAGPWQSYIGKLLDTPTKSRALVMIEGPHGRGVALDVAHLAAA